MNRRAFTLPLILVLAVLLLTGCGEASKIAADPPGDGPTGPGYITAVANALKDTAPNHSSRTIASFDDGSALMDPALSPDGSRIAFVRQEPVKNLKDGGIDFGSDMYVVNRDGSGLREIAHHSALAEYIRGPAWVDDATLLFSVRGGDATGAGDHRLERIDVASGRRARLNQNAVDPTVAPGGKQMLFISVETTATRETVMLASIDGSDARDLLPQEPALSLIGSAVMSPDGTRVAFAAGDLNGARAGGGGARTAMLPGMLHPFLQDVWIVNVDGSGLHRAAEVVERSLSLSWSPDGTSLYAMGTEKLRLIDLATGKITVFGEGAPQAGVFVYKGK